MGRLSFWEIKYLIENKPQEYKEYVEGLSKSDFYKMIVDGLKEAEKSLSIVSALNETLDRIRIDEFYKEKGERLENHLN